MQLKDICYLEEKLWPVYHKAETSLCWKGPYSQRYGFPVVMYGCESWTIKKAEHRRTDAFHRRTDAFKLWYWRRLLSLLDSKDTKPVNPKGNQPWMFIGRTDAEAETLIFWPCDVKWGLISKDSDAGRDWRQEEKGTTKDKMVGWHHRLNEHEFEQTQGDSEGQGSLLCCSPWGCKKSDAIEQQ